MNGFLLDTHIWVWAQQRQEKKLSAKAFAQIEQWQRAKALYISAFSAWEITLLEMAGKIQLGTPPERFLEQAIADGGFQLMPVSPWVLIESVRLPGNLHRDPADRILIATARENGQTLVTRDDDILAYAKQGHVNALKL